MQFGGTCSPCIRAPDMSAAAEDTLAFDPKLTTMALLTKSFTAARPACVRAPARSLVRLQASKKPVPSKNAPAPVETDDEDIGTIGLAAAAAGLVFNPLVLYSEYTLKTTGAGLPPGPAGLVGAAEGIGYLVVVGIVAWSAYTKATTGKGLPAGPSGLLGAAEGFSYLSLLGGIIVFALNFAEQGSVPGITG